MNGVEVVEEMGRRVGGGDMEGAVALLHPGFRLHQPASLRHGGWHEGSDGMAAMRATFARYWQRTSAEIRGRRQDAHALLATRDDPPSAGGPTG